MKIKTIINKFAITHKTVLKNNKVFESHVSLSDVTDNKSQAMMFRVIK